MFSKILRSAPPFKGKHRLARIFLKNLINRSSDVVISGNYDCKFILPNLKENIGFEILINGIYERETVEYLIKNIPRGKILIDIGANIGAILIPVCKQRNDITSICVEAAPWIYKYLKANVEANNLTNTILINKAISNESRKKVLFYGPKEEFGKGSLSPVFTKKGITVETTSLDDLIRGYDPDDIGFIKIDVEGFEYFGFLGGSKLLKKNDAPDILFEFVDWAEDSTLSVSAGAAQNLLMDLGYQLYLFENGTVNKRIDTCLTKGAYMLLASKNIKK